MGYTTSQIYQTHDRIIIDVRQFTLSIWKHPLRFEFVQRHPTIGGLRLCDRHCQSGLTEWLVCHRYHCPVCNQHLTSLLLCPVCGKRHDWPKEMQS